MEGPPAGRDALVYSEPPWAAGTLQGPLGHFLSEFLSFPVFSLYVANPGSPFSSFLRFPFSEKPLWPPWMGPPVGIQSPSPCIFPVLVLTP